MIQRVFFLGAVIFMLARSLYAYEGDCISCHPRLEKMKGKEAKDHAPLKLCKNCHKKTMSDHNLSDSTASGCGQDCWECHDIRKVQSLDIKVHKKLGRCIECHLKLDRSLLRPHPPTMIDTIYQ